MTQEGTEFEKKSLSILTKANPDWDEVVKACVAFANSRGGKILIGIEDDAETPSPCQRVPPDLNELISKRIPQLTLNVGINTRKAKAANGGEYLEIEVFRNTQTVAATSDGKYFIRVADESRPLLPDELTRLMNDKSAYVWEAQTSKHVSRHKLDDGKLDTFVGLIHQSDRASAFVKAKSIDELLDYYLFTSGQRFPYTS